MNIKAFNKPQRPMQITAFIAVVYHVLRLTACFGVGMDISIFFFNLTKKIPIISINGGNYYVHFLYKSNI